ncbi:unnamed protein product [Phaeothamnion confervicola]
MVASAEGVAAATLATLENIVCRVVYLRGGAARHASTMGVAGKGAKPGAPPPDAASVPLPAPRLTLSSSNLNMCAQRLVPGLAAVGYHQSAEDPAAIEKGAGAERWGNVLRTRLDDTCLACAAALAEPSVILLGCLSRPAEVEGLRNFWEGAVARHTGLVLHIYGGFGSGSCVGSSGGDGGDGGSGSGRGNVRRVGGVTAVSPGSLRRCGHYCVVTLAPVPRLKDHEDSGDGGGVGGWRVTSAELRRTAQGRLDDDGSDDEDGERPKASGETAARVRCGQL